MRTSDHVDKIAPAFLRAQKRFKPVIKRSANDFFKSKYADIEAVFESCKQELNDEGIAVLQPASSIDGVTYGVDTVLLHESGQWFAEMLQLKPTKNDPQGDGSAITYARRYGLASIAGLVLKDDDDGNAASGAGSSAPGGTISKEGGEHVVTFGKFKGKKVKDISESDLNNYAKYLLDTAKANNKPITGTVKAFIDNAALYVADGNWGDSSP